MADSRDIVIREADMADCEALREYAAKLFAEELPGIYRRDTPTIEEERDFVRGYVDSANSTLFAAVTANRVVGVLGLQGRTLEQEAHVGSVGVSVDREHRGRRLGTRLFERLFEWAPGHGISRIELEAFACNKDAIRLYERLGFEHEGVRRGAVEVNGLLTDVVMLAKLMR